MPFTARKHAIIAAIALTLAAASPSLAAARIVVNALSEVAGEKILVGEIAAISGMMDSDKLELSGRSLGPSPKPGSELKLSASQVKTRLYNAGVDVKAIETVIPAQVVFKRKTTVVTGRQLADYSIDYLQNNISWGETPIKARAKRLPADILLPAGEVTFEGVIESRTDQYGTQNFHVEIYLDGEKVRDQPMSSYMEALGQVVTAAGPIKAGDILSEDDVTLAEMPLGKLPGGALASVEEATGKKARHNIGKGAVLTRGTMDMQPDVKNNDILTVQLSGDGFTITTRGKALQKGFKGETIKVLVLSSKKILEGVITDSQTVEVVSQ